MKKTLNAIVALVLALSVVCLSFGTVQASSGGPSVISISGDQEFTVTTREPAALDGMTAVSGELIVPAGFPLGEKQFSGQAVIVSGLSYGSARICFDFPGYAYGWTGSVYQWVDGQWVKLPTTITPGVEGSPAKACAEISSDGTYALIIGYTTPAAKKIAACTDYRVSSYGMGVHNIDHWIQIGNITIMSVLPAGAKYSYKIVDVLPAGSLSGAMSGTMIVRDSGAESLLILDSMPGLIYYQPDDMPITFTFRLFINGCYLDIPITLRIFPPVSPQG